MSFPQYEKSRGRGEPTTLYYFRYGNQPNAFYGYTDAEKPVIFNGDEYVPTPIDRGNLTANGTLDKAMLEIRTPQDVDLAGLFKVYPPTQVVNCIIRQGHIGDPGEEWLVVWTGRIVSCAWESNQAKFSCEPVSTSMRRTGLRRHYQYGCPHVLYGSECRASKLAATITRTVVSVDDFKITLQDGWTAAGNVSNYVGGMIEWDGLGGTEARTILSIAGLKTLSLSGPARGMEAGDSIKVILGCKRTMQACRNVHDNILNFGGQPWIPTKNPIGTANNFY